MTSSETLKSLYFFREEFDKLALTFPDCGETDCLSCPLHMPYNVFMKDHMETDCVRSILHIFCKDLPVLCPECGHVTTRRPKLCR